MLELVILCRLLRERCGGGELVEQCLDRASAVFARPACQERMVRVTSLFTYYALFSALLGRCDRAVTGSAGDRLRRLAEDRRRHPLLLPRNAQGVLELRYALDLARLPHDLPSAADLYADFALAGSPDLTRIDDLDAYAITHVIFYLTDMGAHPLRSEELTECVAGLLALSVARRDWDLTAEFLLCWKALGRPPTKLTSFAWRCIGRHQREDGAVLGPRYDPASPHRDLREYRFATCYHTTLVTAMAATVWRLDAD